MRYILFLTFLASFLSFGQTRIDGNFPFDTDPEKKYSFYIPSGYDVSTPNKVMLALHPFNTARWDSESWCDTLINFAEANQLILICPDGGEDGRIDDPIDTAFTSALIDSMETWYNLDFDKFYGIGFSWGARGLYTYGLSHPGLIKGYIPVGAAINGTTEVNEALQSNSADLPFYIIHGSLDAPAVRFFPVRDSLISKGAFVETNFLDGVGHTIDFPDRNEALTVAFNWIDAVNCGNTVSLLETDKKNGTIKLFPNPIQEDGILSINMELEKNATFDIEIRSLDWKLIQRESLTLSNGVNYYPFKQKSGAYIVIISNKQIQKSFRVLVAE